MFSSAEKTNRTSTTVQQKAQQQTFFRKAGEESFFGSKEQPSFFNAPIQAKLSISSPDDPQEKEADAVADQVMRMPVTEHSSTSGIISDKEDIQKKDADKEEEVQPKFEAVIGVQSKCDTCEKEGSGHTMHTIQRSGETLSSAVDFADTDQRTGHIINRKEISLYHSNIIKQSGRGPPGNSIPFQQDLSSSKGAGNAMPGNTRKFMENRFQADFGGVRIHTGSQATRMNRKINAHAFTHGNDIYFNENKHDPDSPDGAKLLAHELTHTIQQGASNQNIKNNGQEKTPAQPFDLPVKGNNTLLPGMSPQPGIEQPGLLNNTIPPQEKSLLKDELPKDNQPADPNMAAPMAATPAVAGASPGGEDNNPAAKSLAGNEAPQTKNAKSTTGGSKGQTTTDPEKVGKQEGDEKNGDKAIQINDRINNAPDSAIKPFVINQAALVNQDYFVTEAMLNSTSLSRKQEIRNMFSTARANIDAFFIGNLQVLSAGINAAQATITGQITATLAGMQSIINTTSAMAINLLTTAIGFVTTLVSNTLGIISGVIGNVTNSIANLVNAVNLPDLPGVETVRNFIGNSIASVSGVITASLASVQMLISSAMSVSLQILTGLIQTIAVTINTILITITSVLNGIINGVAAGLQSILQTVIIILQQLLNGKIYPMLLNIEMMVLGTVDKFHQKALQDANYNREQALEALAAMINAQSAPPGAETDGVPMTQSDMIVEIEMIGKYALDRNKQIVEKFDADVSFLIGLLQSRLVVFVALIMAAIIGGIVTVLGKVMQLIRNIIQYITQLATKIIAQVLKFISKIIESIAALMTAVSEFITGPLNTVKAFMENVLDAIRSFISNVVSNFISDLFNVNSQQGPAVQYLGQEPTTQLRPGPEPDIGTIIGEIIQAIVAAVASVFLAIILGIATAIAFLLQVVIPWIMVGIAMLLLLIFIIRMIGASIPWPWPKPKPKEFSMKHETKFNAADGSPKTRNEVGVGEEVEFTGSLIGDWAATAGTPLLLPAENKFKWTAPERANNVTVTLTVGTKSIAEVMQVIEPSHYTGVKVSEYSFAPGEQGAGMILDFNFHPQNVSFGNVEQKEVSGPATNVTGYYLMHGMPHHHNSGDTFWAISEDNLFDGNVKDRAAQWGFPQPWDAGTWDWIIPNHFRVKTETGNGKLYHNATQSFIMVDATGESSVSKEGESVTRMP